MTRLARNLCFTLCVMMVSLTTGEFGHAANLVQNPGFENNPPSTLSGHVNYSILPWIIGGGAQSNVVQVDGPGGFNYGNNGPESDGTAPGAGIRQNYLDITSGNNDLYQSFTVRACPESPEGTTVQVQYSGKFSTRANSSGSGRIDILQGVGPGGTVIATNTVALPNGNSQFDAWKTVSGTANVIRGSTFTYLVVMDNNLNFDDAVVTINDDPCDAREPDKTGTVIIEKKVEAKDPSALALQFAVSMNCDDGTSKTGTVTASAPLVFTGLPVGASCIVAENKTDPPKDLCKSGSGKWVTTTAPKMPLTVTEREVRVVVTNELKCDDTPAPRTASCLTGETEVTCGKTPGTYVVTLTPSNSGGGAPDEVEITVLTPGVTIVNAKPKYQVNANGAVKLTLAGATPGQTISLDTSGSQLDPDSKDGMSICCNGKTEITIPKDLPCDPPPPGDVSIKKECSPAKDVVGATQGALEAKCKITVTSTGPVAGPLNISEVLSGAGTITAIAHADPWTCAPATPVPANTVLGCSLPGSTLNPAGDTSVIDVTVSFPNSGSVSEAKNCAKLSLADKAKGEDCKTFAPPPKLTIEKVGPENCAPNTPCDFTIKVTSVGSPFSGDVLLYDAVTPNPWNVLAVTPNVCGALPTTTPFGCVANLTLQADTPFTFKVTLNTPYQGPLRDENCITIGLAPSGLVKNKIYSKAELEALAAQGVQLAGNPAQSCFRFRQTPPPPPPGRLICDRGTAKLVGAACRCTIDGMVPVSKTACACPDGTTLRAGACVKPPPKCDGVTAVAKGNACICRYPAMNKVTASACRCAAGFDFKAGKGCIRKPPVCRDGTRYNPKRGRCEPLCPRGTQYNVKRNTCEKQVPRCDRATAVPAGNGCECRYEGMRKLSPTRCICPRGTVFVPGRGCQERKRPQGLKCEFPSIPNPLTGKCEKLRFKRGESQEMCNDNGIPVPCN